MEARIDTHPAAESLKAFGLGLLDEASASALCLHLDGCPACRQKGRGGVGGLLPRTPP